MYNTHVVNLDVHFFENPKIKLIRSKADGHAYLNFWIYLLTLGATAYSDDTIGGPDGNPFSVQDMSVISGFHPRIIQEALELFEEFHMIVFEEGYIKLRNWKYYQLMEGYYD